MRSVCLGDLKNRLVFYVFVWSDLMFGLKQTIGQYSEGLVLMQLFSCELTWIIDSLSYQFKVKSEIDVLIVLP